MDLVHFSSDVGEHTVEVTRVADMRWLGVEDGRVVARGEASRRLDGRVFLSVDAWHDVVFDRLAAAMVAALPTPLYTVVDEADHDLTSSWQRAGFTVRRREWEYVVPTDPRLTGLGSVRPPTGTSIADGEAVDEKSLRALDSAIRAEVEATVGWQEMPAEVVLRPDTGTALDRAKYTVAVEAGTAVGLVRVAPVTRRPRIGLVAVLAGRRRRGVARALLVHVLGSLHGKGFDSAVAEVKETDPAASALFTGIGARRASSNLELVLTGAEDR